MRMSWAGHILRLIAFCGVIFLTSQCDAVHGLDVHEFPGENPVDPTLINTKIRLLPCPDMTAYYPENEHLRDITNPLNDPSEVLMARYRLEVYVDESFNKSLIYSETIIADRKDLNKVIERDFTLNALHYKVLVWQDLVKSATAGDLWYSTSSLNSIKVWESSVYKGMSDRKLTQATNETVDLSIYASQWNIEKTIDIPLARPQAKYVLITTDLKKFANSYGAISDLKDCRIRVSYNGFMPSGYNVSTGLLNDSKGGYGYDAYIYQLNDKEAIVAFDYTLVGPSDTSVELRVEVFDKDGNLLNSVNSVKVPLSRNKFTIIKKEFLTKEYGGGVGIDSEFDGEYNIYV